MQFIRKKYAWYQKFAIFDFFCQNSRILNFFQKTTYHIPFERKFSPDFKKYYDHGVNINIWPVIVKSLTGNWPKIGQFQKNDQIWTYILHKMEIFRGIC